VPYKRVQRGRPLPRTAVCSRKRDASDQASPPCLAKSGELLLCGGTGRLGCAEGCRWLVPAWGGQERRNPVREEGDMRQVERATDRRRDAGKRRQPRWSAGREEPEREAEGTAGTKWPPRQQDNQELQEAQSNLSPSPKAKVTAVWFSSSGTYANKCKLMHNYGDRTHLAPRHQEAHVPFAWQGQTKSPGPSP